MSSSRARSAGHQVSVRRPIACGQLGRQDRHVVRVVADQPTDADPEVDHAAEDVLARPGAPRVQRVVDRQAHRHRSQLGPPRGRRPELGEAERGTAASRGAATARPRTPGRPHRPPSRARTSSPRRCAAGSLGSEPASSRMPSVAGTSEMSSSTLTASTPRRSPTWRAGSSMERTYPHPGCRHAPETLSPSQVMRPAEQVSVSNNLARIVTTHRERSPILGSVCVCRLRRGDRTSRSTPHPRRLRPPGAARAGSCPSSPP